MITWTGNEILKQARYANGSLGDGTTISADELADDLIALNMLLASWDVLLYARVKETKALTAGDADYSWGITTGDISTARPIDLVDQTFIRRGTIDYPVRLINEVAYRAISDKTIAGLPSQIFFDPQMPLAYIYLHPVPDAADTIYLCSVKEITEITDATAELVIPSELAAAIKWNLSIELAPNYGVPVTQVMAQRAMQTKLVVLNRAVKQRVTPAHFDNMTGINRNSNTSILSY